MWSILADMSSLLTALADGLFRVTIRTEGAAPEGSNADAATVTTEVDMLTGSIHHRRPAGVAAALVVRHAEDRAVSDTVRGTMAGLIRQFLHLEGELDRLPEDADAAGEDDGT